MNFTEKDLQYKEKLLTGKHAKSSIIKEMLLEGYARNEVKNILNFNEPKVLVHYSEIHRIYKNLGGENTGTKKSKTVEDYKKMYGEDCFKVLEDESLSKSDKARILVLQFNWTKNHVVKALKVHYSQVHEALKRNGKESV